MPDHQNGGRADITSFRAADIGLALGPHTTGRIATWAVPAKAACSRPRIYPLARWSRHWRMTRFAHHWPRGTDAGQPAPIHHGRDG